MRPNAAIFPLPESGVDSLEEPADGRGGED